MSGQYKVAWLCEALLVSRSGYYDWKERRQLPGSRQLENIRLRERIREEFARSRQTYGSPPNIDQPPPTAVTADPSRLTDCTTSLFDAPIRSGSAMPPQC